MNDTWQPPELSVHDVGLKLPGEEAVKLTVPLGAGCPFDDWPVTVAVHVVGASTLTVAGLQLTAVEVGRALAVTAVDP